MFVGEGVPDVCRRRPPAMFRSRTFIVCVALLAQRAGWRAGARTDLAGQGPAETSPLDQLLAAFKWRSIGPDRGGRSIAVTGVKGRPREAYFGATGGGLWKTTDGGMKWAPVT